MVIEKFRNIYRNKGNGRIARVMMNSELVNAGHSRIMIPTVYREDYLGALRKLTRNNDPSIYIKMLQRAQKFSHRLDASADAIISKQP